MVGAAFPPGRKPYSPTRRARVYEPEAGLEAAAMKRCSAMRIYAVADIHGKPEKIALVREKTEALKPDALVVAGDITNSVIQLACWYQCDRVRHQGKY